MTKTLKRITGVCGAVLMVTPLVAGAAQLSPVNANAKRRYHRTYRTYRRAYRAPRRARRKAATPKRKRAKNTYKSSQYMQVGGSIVNKKFFSQYVVPKKYRKHTTKKPAKRAKRTKMSKKQRKLVKKLETPRKNKVENGVNDTLASSVAAQKSYVAQQYQGSGIASGTYVPMSEYQSIENDSQLWPSTKSTMVSLAAVQDEFKPASQGTITFWDGYTISAGTGQSVADPMAASSASSVAPSSAASSEGLLETSPTLLNSSSMPITSSEYAGFEAVTPSATSEAPSASTNSEASTYSMVSSLGNLGYSTPSADDGNLVNSQVGSTMSALSADGVQSTGSERNELQSAYSYADSVEAQGASSVAPAQSAAASNADSDFENVSDGTQSGLASEAVDFANAVQTAPISSTAKNSLITKYGTNPQSAASEFANSVNGVSPKRVKSDKAFQSAMSSATAPSNDTTSLAYSANPSKAMSKASSVAASDGSKANGSSAQPIAFTSNPLDADQSKQLTNDRSAVNDMIHGVSAAGNHNSVNEGSVKPESVSDASVSLEKVPEMLNGTTALMSQPTNGKIVMGPQKIQEENQKPNYGNTFMIYQQANVNGNLWDHVVSYDNEYNGWVPDSGIQAGATPEDAAVPSGTFHFSHPSTDGTYEYPLGTTWADPYVLNRTDAVGADSLEVTAARKANKNGKQIVSYYVKDAAHPYINGWVNKDELAKSVAKNASSKPANTPKKSGNGYTKFSVNVMGDLSEAPLAMNEDKVGTDTLRMPTSFSADQIKALHGNTSDSVNWKALNDNFLGKDKAMNKFNGTATYYKQNGHIVYVPKSDVAAEQKSGKPLFHFVYKIDRTVTRRANKNAKNGDVVTVYYKRVQVAGPAKAEKVNKANAKVVTAKSNQKPSNKPNQKVSTPKK